MPSRLSFSLLTLLAALSVPASATAADDTAPFACPALPESSGLRWEIRDQGTFMLCRAMDAGDLQVFGIMLTQDKPDLRLDKRLRAEAGAVNGQGMFWYYPNAGGNALKTRRIAVVEIGEERYAQIWIDAPDEQRMQALQNVVRALALR